MHKRPADVCAALSAPLCARTDSASEDGQTSDEAMTAHTEGRKEGRKRAEREVSGWQSEVVVRIGVCQRRRVSEQSGLPVRRSLPSTPSAMLLLSSCVLTLRACWRRWGGK